MRMPVVAGNYSQYIQKFRDDPAYFYVSSIRDLKGIHGVKVLCVGTYYERSDWDEIEREIAMVELT